MSPPATLLDKHSPIQWAENFYRPGKMPATKEEAIKEARYRAEALHSTDQDERLAYMESEEWGFSTDHLRQVNRVISTFLDDTARQEIRNLASECLKENRQSLEIAGQWFTAERYEWLQKLLETTEVPDPLLVACYAWLEVHEMGQAAYLLAQNRNFPQPNFTNFRQDTDEIEADICFVNAI